MTKPNMKKVAANAAERVKRKLEEDRKAEEIARKANQPSLLQRLFGGKKK